MSSQRWRKEARNGTETTSRIPLFSNDSLPLTSYKSINGWLKQLQWRVSVSELLSDCGLSQVLIYSSSTSNLRRFAVVYSLHSILKWKSQIAVKKQHAVSDCALLNGTLLSFTLNKSRWINWWQNWECLNIKKHNQWNQLVETVLTV